jgi:protein gp37
MKIEWVTSIRDQCKYAAVPFFFKQWGKRHFNPNLDDPTIDRTHPHHAKGGCQIDGQIYRALPFEGRRGPNISL